MKDDRSVVANGYRGGDRLWSLNIALDVLEALAAAQTEAGVSDLARQVGRSKSTVHSILVNLCARNYVSRDPASMKYSLGLRTWEIATTASNPLHLQRVAHGHLQALTDLSGETSHLAVYADGDVVYLDKVESQNPVQAYTRVGGRAPAYCVATGKALLANQDNAELRRLYRTEVKRFTPFTIVDLVEMEAEVTVVRERGYAVNRGEWREEVVGVAAAIMGPGGRAIAAIGLSGPSYRFSAARALALGPDVVAAAAAISSELVAAPVEPQARG